MAGKRYAPPTAILEKPFPSFSVIILHRRPQQMI